MRSLVLITDDVAGARRVRSALRHATALRLAATLDSRTVAGEEIAQLAPDVVLVTDSCQHVNTTRRLREVRRWAPWATVLLLAAPGCGETAEDAFGAGADGVISSDTEDPALGGLLGLIGLGQLALPARGPEVAAPAAGAEPPLRLIGAQDARGTRAKA